MEGGLSTEVVAVHAGEDLTDNAVIMVWTFLKLK